MDLLFGFLTVTAWVVTGVIGTTIICDFCHYLFFMTNTERTRYRPFLGWVYILLLISIIFLITKAIYYVPGSLSCTS